MNELSHVAIIMDGNGRWAQKRGLNRSAGHEEGAKTVERITECAAKNGVKYLTLYAFSTENWKRSKSEVLFLMSLLKRFLKSHLGVLQKNNIRFETIGDLSRLDKALQKEIQNVKEKTRSNSALVQILAINYGSRDEIMRAAAKLAAEKLDVTEQNLNSKLDTSAFGDVDLLIRTGGESRLSNFLLWQASYAELFFTNTLWPDFEEREFEAILENYKRITRKFGGV